MAGRAKALHAALDMYRASSKLAGMQETQGRQMPAATSQRAVVLGRQSTGNWLELPSLPSAASSEPGVRVEGLQVRVGDAGTPAACSSDGAPPPLPLALPQPALLSPPLPLCC